MQPGQSAPIATLSDYNYPPTSYPPASGGVDPSFGYSSLQPQQLLPPLQYPTPQPATNCFPAAGYVHDGVGASCVQVGYIAPSSGNQAANAAAATAATAKPGCVVQQHQQVKNYAGYVALAVFVFMCCCPICGCLAICYAGVANSKAATDRSAARRAARVSLALSLGGVAIAAIVVVVVVVSVLCSNYRVAGQCFRHREVTDHFSCSFNHFDGIPQYDNGYCYWN